MKYSGGFLPEKNNTIRNYLDDDYMRADYIWARGIYEMEKRIGLPVGEWIDPTKTEKYRQDYRDEANNYYVIENDGKIIGCGNIMSGNVIGSLAVDMELHNIRYGTALAIFLTNEILRRGNDAAHLYCEAKNDNAFHVYEKIGYKVISTIYSSFKKLK